MRAPNSNGPDLIRMLAEKVRRLSLGCPITLMEVCGTHTMAIHRSGIRSLLPENLKLISGPGCPVCVTPKVFLDSAIAMARQHNVVLATFGDMVRVPGTDASLADLRREGYGVEIVYSALDAVEYARANPPRQTVFLAVGFETTAPTVAAAVKNAAEMSLRNFSILSAHKLLVPALEILVDDPGLAIDGFILPGHVSAIIGSQPYRFLADNHRKGCVVAGFDPADVLQAIVMLVRQIQAEIFSVEIQYDRVARAEGNPKARAFIDDIFLAEDTAWRGFGAIPRSGLALRPEYDEFSALSRFPVDVVVAPDPPGCRCGEVLRGQVEPHQCSLFGHACTPENPVGPCMVSSEGTCAAFYHGLRSMSAFTS